MADRWDSWNDLAGRHPRRTIAGAVLLVAVTGLLAASQLLLPGWAASRLRDSLRRDGTVQSVSVSASPALKLLGGHADSARVHFAVLHANPRRTTSLLARMRAARDVDVSIDRLTEGPLVLRDASLRKRGNRLSASATLSTASIAAALPPGLSATPLASSGGQLLFRAGASAFGFAVSATVALAARNGALVLAPAGLGSFVQLTVFSDPHARVDALSIRRISAGAYRVQATGHMA